MKKKIITLALAVVMCLSVMTSVTAASNLNRVASIIPGTDIEYNYVENVTVQIPGTEVTYELIGVYEKVGLEYQNGIPVYRFAFLESGGKVVVNQEGVYGMEILIDGENRLGDVPDFQVNDELLPSFNYYANKENAQITREIIMPADAGSITERNYTKIYEDGSCNLLYDGSVPTVIVEFWFGYGGVGDNGYEHPYDLISFEGNDLIDVSLLDINYEEPKDYSIINGANSVVNSNDNVFSIRADGDFDKFTGVKVDGALVDSSNYTATEGSTIIEFKADYLKTLDAGEHTVSVVFTDGEATTKFEIAEDKNTDSADKNENTDNFVTDVEIPDTDYNTSVVPVFVAMAISGMALIGFKKRK